MKLIGRYLKGQLTAMNIQKYQYLPETIGTYGMAYPNI